MHKVWKGSLSLGLLNIGIKLYSAVEENDIKFLSLHKECLTPIKYKKIAPDYTDTEVSDEEIVKAYEYAPHKYMFVEDKELEALQKKMSHESFAFHLLSKMMRLIQFLSIVPILLVLPMGMKSPICC